MWKKRPKEFIPASYHSEWRRIDLIRWPAFWGAQAASLLFRQLAETGFIFFPYADRSTHRERKDSEIAAMVALSMTISQTSRAT
jgi:hypothetical protein